jgi:hypothetical protein
MAHVGVEEASGVVAVGADAPDFGREVNDHVGLEVVVHPHDRRFTGQVVFRVGRHIDRLGALLAQLVAEHPPEESRPAGHRHTLAFQFHVMLPDKPRRARCLSAGAPRWVHHCLFLTVD